MRHSRYFENSCLLVLLLANTLPLGALAQGGNSGSKRKVALGPAGLPMVTPHVVHTLKSDGIRPAISPATSSSIKKLARSSYPSGPYERGLYYKQKGQLDDALIEFIHAAQINPRDTRAFFEQAKIFQARGLNKLARSAMEQALALEPTNVGFRSQLVQLHVESGNFVGAAAEVGKLFNLNQSSTSTHKKNSGLYISPPAAAVQVASGQTQLPATNDASSAWLNSAVATDTGRSASASTPNLDEVLSSVGAAAESPKKANAELAPAKDTEIASTAAAPFSVAQILNSVPSAAEEKLVPPEKIKSEKPAAPLPPGNVAEVLEKSGAQNPVAAEPSIFDRANSMFAWARDKMPFAHDKMAEKVEPTPAPSEHLPKGASRTAAMVSWAKDKIPFAHEKDEPKQEKTADKKADGSNNGGKLAKAVAVASWAKEKIPFAHPRNQTLAASPEAKQEHDLFAAFKGMRDKVEASLHLKPANDPVKAAFQNAQGQQSAMPNIRDANDPDKKLSPEIAKQALKAIQDSQGAKKNGKNVVLNSVPTQEVKNADSKSNLPPEIAKALEGKFNGPTVFTSSNTPEEAAAKAKAKTDDLVKQVLSSVPSVKEVEKETARPEPSGPKYGLLSNNAFKHVGTSQPPSFDTQRGEGIMGMLKQAGKTFAGLMPSIKWSLPSLPSLASLKSKEDTPEAIIANVPAQELVDGGTGAGSNAADSSARPAAESITALTPAHGASPSPAPPPDAVLTPAHGVVSADAVQGPPSAVDNVLNALGSPAKAVAEQVQSIVSSIQSAQAVPPSSSAPDNITQALAPAQPFTSASEQTAALNPGAVVDGAKARGIVPLDVSRILSKISSATPTAPKLTASNPIAPSLSSIMPIAANPVQDFQALIPKPIAADAQNATNALPTLGAKGFSPTNTGNLMPQSSPQATAQPAMTQATVPPMVQEAINQAQPLLKPAMDAANQLAQTIAPMVIPHAAYQAPQVVATQSNQAVANTVPTPVGKDMANYYRDLQKYYHHAPIPDGTEGSEQPVLEQSAGPARKLIDIQQTKSGAFTYMKPVIDSDRNYLLGGKKVRTIQPLPGKPMVAKAAVPEDAITKRMRYLLEHGTGTLKPGEAFMFSEETGEGTLFMPDGSCEKRKLQDSQDAEKVMRSRRPDIVNPKDLQYSLSLLGKLLPPQENKDPNQQTQLNGPTLDQLLQQMNQQSKGVWGWMKKSFNIK